MNEQDRSRKMTRIANLKQRGFFRIEPNSYADNYGINVVFEENNSMDIAISDGTVVLTTNMLDKANAKISEIRTKIMNP